MFPRGTTATECRRGSYTERERNKYIKGEERRERGSEAADTEIKHIESEMKECRLSTSHLSTSRSSFLSASLLFFLPVSFSAAGVSFAFVQRDRTCCFLYDVI